MLHGGKKKPTIGTALMEQIGFPRKALIRAHDFSGKRRSQPIIAGFEGPENMDE